MEKRNYLAVLLRLFIYPLVVLIVFKVLDLTDWIADGKNLLLIVFLACVTPACATVTSMAQLYDKNSAEASLFYVLTTLFSIISMPLMILVLKFLLTKNFYPRDTSSIIIRLNPTAKHRVPTSEWRPGTFRGSALPRQHRA